MTRALVSLALLLCACVRVEVKEPPTLVMATAGPSATAYPTYTAQATYTAQPTYTPNPTYTERPTFTPEPTATEQPTFTPLPTYTPYPPPEPRLFIVTPEPTRGRPIPYHIPRHNG